MSRGASRASQTADLPFRGPVVCLLPARNAETDLPGWFESVRGFADAVVALDDGSTDGTLAALRAEPLVQVLLGNAPRTTYAGWDDGANRNRLLAAAAPLSPQWIVSLDADERLDAHDARALRTFLETDALPGCAFGLQHFRMWGADRYDPDYSWIYRVFAYRPEQMLPATRLHFDPVPVDIPRGAWLRTTVRVRHLGAVSDASLAARAVKYQQADPTAEFRDSPLLLRPGTNELPLWRSFAPSVPVLLPRRRRRRSHDAESIPDAGR